MKKWLGLLLLLPLVFVGLAWLSLPWSARYLMEHWLTEQGFEAPALTLRHPSWQRLQIDHLSLSQASDGRRLSLSADNIQLHFDPLNLLRGQLAELRVEQARLQIQADHSLKGRAEQLQQHGTLDLNRFHPQQLFHYAPSRRLVIARLELSYTAPEQPPIDLTGNLDLEPRLLQGRLQLSVDQQRLGYLDLSLDPDYRLQLQLSQSGNTPIRSWLQLTPEAETWQLEANTHLQAEQLIAAISPLQLPLPAELQQLNGELELTSQLTLSAQLPTDANALPHLSSRHHFNTQLTLPAASSHPGGQIRLEGQLDQQGEQLQLQLTPPSSLVLELPGQPALPQVGLQADLKLELPGRQLSGPVTLSTRTPPLQLDTTLELTPELNGHLDFTLQPLDAAELLSSLHPWLTDLSLWPTIHQGRIQAQGQLTLEQGNWQLTLQPSLEQLSLSLDNTHLHDLNLDSRISLQPDGRLSARGNLRLDHTDAGLRIYGPDLKYALTGYGNQRYWLQLTPFSLSLLDGIIAVPALGFDPLQPEVDTRLAVSALNLSRILALYPQEGLYGDGVLGGELPIRFSQQQLHIDSGQLLSGAEGGVIRYQPTPEIALMGQQNPGIQLALDALTDFRYDLLALTLNYHPSGETEISARLKGHNPSWQQGRPVDLNLNIEENLLDLLRTLQLTGRVTDSIDRRFNR